MWKTPKISGNTDLEVRREVSLEEEMKGSEMKKRLLTRRW
jgi:hypothetical protein